MKKIYSLIALLAAATVFMGCADNDAVIMPDTPLGMVEVRAYTGAETRTTIDNDYNVLWSANDKIVIGSNEFTLSTGEGTTSGTFTGTAPADGEYTAYYPSTYKGTIWPDQKYAGADNISGAPMKATTTVSNGQIAALGFKNVGGVLRYTVKGSKIIKSINVKGNGLDITLDCGDGVALTADGTVFNIALPEGSYSNAKLSFLATDGTMATKTAATFKVTKNKVSKATFEATALSFEVSAYAPAGTTAIIYGREAVVVDLPEIGKVAVATENVSKGDQKYFSSTDISAPDFLSDGWYVPSAQELKLLSSLFSNSNWNTLSTKGRALNINGQYLFLPAAGFEYRDADSQNYNVANNNEIGVYVSREALGTNFYSLLFDENDVKFADYGSTEAGYRYSVRPFHRLEGNLPLPTIDKDSPEGTYGMFHGQEAIVVKVGGKLMAMATKNLGADRPSDFGNYYFASEANDAASMVNDFWRLPTNEELAALKATYPIGSGNSKWGTENGVPGWQISFSNGNTLFFPTAGYSAPEGNVQHEGEEGVYWTSTKISDHEYYLWLKESSTLMKMTEMPSTRKGTARLIRELELPEGAIGSIDGRLAIMADLGGSYGKVAIALMDEGASSISGVGIKYNWEDAKALQSNGWYLPSAEEFDALVDRYIGNLNYGTKATYATWTIGGNSLYMPYSVYFEETTYACWTSTTHSVENLFGPDYPSSPHYFYIEVERTPHTAKTFCKGSISETDELHVRLFHKLQ